MKTKGESGMAVKKKYDIETIKQYVDMEMLCDHLGLETTRKGGRISVLCPFHDDVHFGSAYIYDTKITCFVCGHSYDIFSVTMKILNYDFYDTLEYLVNEFQIPNCVAKYKVTEKRRFPLTKEELKMIGLCSGDNRKPERYPLKYSEGQKGMMLYSIRSGEDSVLVQKGTSVMSHIRDLYYNEQSVFWEIVLGKCSEKEKLIKDTLFSLNRHESEQIIYEMNSFLFEQLWLLRKLKSRLFKLSSKSR